MTKTFHISIKEWFADDHPGESWNYDAHAADPSEALERVAAELRVDDGSFIGSLTPVESCTSVVVANVEQLKEALVGFQQRTSVFTVRPDGTARPIIMVDDPSHGIRIL